MIPFLLIALSGLAVRVAYQQERRYDPARYDLAYGMDQYNYDRLAFSLVNNDNFFPGVIYSLPGYPAFLYLLYLSMGRSLDLIWFLQAGLGALSCGLTYLIGRKVMGDKAGWLAAFSMIFYGPAIYCETLLIPTTAALLLSLTALTWWIYLPGQKHLSVWLAGGVLLGLSIIFSAPNLIFGLLLVCLWIPWINRGLPRSVWKIATSSAGILVVIIPFALKSSYLSGNPIALTAHSGINFFIGNNQAANGGFLTPTFLTPSATGIIRDSQREAESRSGKKFNPGEASRFWWREGSHFFIGAPIEEIKLWLNKLCLILSAREYLDVGGGGGEGDSPFALHRFPLISFGWIAPFALAGIFLTARRDRALFLLYLYLGAHILAVLIFYYQGRARILIIPICAVFAAGSVRSIYLSIRRKHYQRAILAAGLILAALVVVRSQPIFEMRSETNLLLARAQQDLAEDEISAARIRVNRALDINPNLSGPNLILGDICFREGDNRGALEYFRRENERDPLDPEPLLRISQISNIKEDYARAEKAGRQALSIDPLSWKAYSILADSYYFQGDRKNELYNSRRAVELNPNSIKDHSNLARYYAREGDPGMAEYHWKQVKRINVQR